MFTGIISDIGRIHQLTHEKGSIHLLIRTSYRLDDVALGASIACNGICLTVTDKTTDSFAVTASGETIAVTTLGNWRSGDDINLERALKMGDELGGHMVSGHVDGLAHITAIESTDVSHKITLKAPAALARYIARKGSVALDGISLTVNAVDGDDFTVNIIPYTWQHTNLYQRRAGDSVNLEVDMLARYAERFMGR